MIASFGLVMKSLKSTLSSAEILINVATSVIGTFVVSLDFGDYQICNRHRFLYLDQSLDDG